MQTLFPRWSAQPDFLKDGCASRSDKYADQDGRCSTRAPSSHVRPVKRIITGWAWSYDDAAGWLSGIAFDLNGNPFEQCDAKGNIQSFRVTVAGQPRHVRLQLAGKRAGVGGIAQTQDQPEEQEYGAENHPVDLTIAYAGIVPKGEE